MRRWKTSTQRSKIAGLLLTRQEALAIAKRIPSLEVTNSQTQLSTSKVGRKTIATSSMATSRRIARISREEKEIQPQCVLRTNSGPEYIELDQDKVLMRLLTSAASLITKSLRLERTLFLMPSKIPRARSRSTRRTRTDG